MTPPKITMYAADDPALWALVGPLLTARAVVREMGGYPLYSDDAVAWWVATVRGKAVGIACLKHGKDGYWEDNDYVRPDHRHKGVHLSLCAARTRHLATLEPGPLNVCCRSARWKHYARRGFAETARKGDWVYGRKPAAPRPEPEETT